MSVLFSSFRMRALSLANRIVVSPMCQYSAENGNANDWHLAHLGQLAVSGAGLVFVEATAVEERGRISHGCLGLYSDENEEALKPVLEHCRKYGSAQLGIQLAHAGRKGSHARPWEGGLGLKPVESPWPTVGPSPLAAGDAAPPPTLATIADIAELKSAFVIATERAQRLGFDVIELHAAHGYLLHEFLSPIANQRTDEYGGSRENRMRFVLEVFSAVRAAWPVTKPLGVRVSAVDWVDGGITIEDTVALAQALKQLGCDFITASSGGVSTQQKIPLAPGYQVAFAERIRKEADIGTVAVGLITDPAQAESIVASGQADLVAMARAMLANPRWAWHAADVLGGTASYPVQYLRARPSRR